MNSINYCNEECQTLWRRYISILNLILNLLSCSQFWPYCYRKDAFRKDYRSINTKSMLAFKILTSYFIHTYKCLLFLQKIKENLPAGFWTDGNIQGYQIT